VPCPFHLDERPSLHVYATADRGWTCFSCRRGGSVYDLAAALWGLKTRGRDFVEVRERLLDRYGRLSSLGLGR
jgi:DNA primase